MTPHEQVAAFMKPNGEMFFFGYHSGEQALVSPHPETGAPMGIKVGALRQRGFRVSEDDLAKVLPRFNGSAERELTPRATMAEVEAIARAQRGMATIRGGRR